jgi:hypothetical protein
MGTHKRRVSEPRSDHARRDRQAGPPDSATASRTLRIYEQRQCTHSAASCPANCSARRTRPLRLPAAWFACKAYWCCSSACDASATATGSRPTARLEGEESSPGLIDRPALEPEQVAGCSDATVALA